MYVPLLLEPFSFGGLYGTRSKYGDMDITGDGAMEFFSNRIKITSKWTAPSTSTTTANTTVNTTDTQHSNTGDNNIGNDRVKRIRIESSPSGSSSGNGDINQYTSLQQFEDKANFNGRM